MGRATGSERAQRSGDLLTRLTVLQLRDSWLVVQWKVCSFSEDISVDRATAQATHECGTDEAGGVFFFVDAVVKNDLPAGVKAAGEA